MRVEVKFLRNDVEQKHVFQVSPDDEIELKSVVEERLKRAYPASRTQIVSIVKLGKRP